jgi:glutamate-1-semialdehyde 2,1-aminomutase
MQTTTDTSNRTKSLEWYNRATEVIPGGVYGHTSPAASIPIAFPYYAEQAEGCYFYDVDGNRFLDFMCAYGPIVLGHQHPEVEAAAEKARSKGGLFSHPGTMMVELAETIVDLVDFADWCVFGKNGSDVTTWALQVARQHTGKKKVLVVAGAYHGVDAWTNPSPGGVIEEDRKHIHAFSWNDIDSLHRLVEKHRGEIAALMINPFHHPAFAHNVDPTSAFIEAVNDVCRKEAIVLILDDVRAGFRLHPGGSHRIYPFEPDISCYCKALGNGYPISAAVGKDAFKASAGKVFLTGSYWNDGIAMAAAKTTLEVIVRDDIPARLDALGKLLLDGLKSKAKSSGITLHTWGPNATPMISFDHDPDLRIIQRFAELCARQGVLFHPHHNWFLSAAHTESAINEALAVAGNAFNSLAKEFDLND